MKKKRARGARFESDDTKMKIQKRLLTSRFVVALLLGRATCFFPHTSIRVSVHARARAHVAPATLKFHRVIPLIKSQTQFAILCY